MADLTITAANVVIGSGAVIEHGTAGAAITAGEVVYKDASTSQYLLADCDSATTGARSPRGIALNDAADGQPLTIIKSGDVTIGATLTPGLAYYLSATAGGICPYGDLLSGDYVVFLGLAESASVLAVNIHESGAQIA